MRSIALSHGLSLTLLATSIGCLAPPQTANLPPAPAVVGVPAALTATVSYASGIGAGRAIVVADVVDASGIPVGLVPIQFTVSSGTVLPGPDLVSPGTTGTIITSADAGGQAQVTVIGRGSITVAMAAGTVRASVPINIP